MRKINTKEIPEEIWSSATGKFAGAYQGLSIALGRKERSTNLMERHPFDVEITRVPPGKFNFPYHSHSAQWEFYLVMSGTGTVRHQEGTTPIAAGDTFLFEPGQPHQIINDSAQDLVYLVVADNPMGESCHYPDSNKWMVRSPEQKIIRSESLEYMDGEE